jgi:hypothetical protein
MLFESKSVCLRNCRVYIYFSPMSFFDIFCDAKNVYILKKGDDYLLKFIVSLNKYYGGVDPQHLGCTLPEPFTTKYKFCVKAENGYFEGNAKLNKYKEKRRKRLFSKDKVIYQFEYKIVQQEVSEEGLLVHRKKIELNMLKDGRV